jgi:predicted enzyme related to lactoylglutathione lyase
MANTLIFVDIPVSDPRSADVFYSKLFEWKINPSPEGQFHQIVPDGLHLGLFNSSTQYPHPKPPNDQTDFVSVVAPRIYILVDDAPHVYLQKAILLGATKVWDEIFWETFSGFHASFRDPWLNQIVLWESTESRAARLRIDDKDLAT